jgi:hypothetical protein
MSKYREVILYLIFIIIITVGLIIKIKPQTIEAYQLAKNIYGKNRQIPDLERKLESLKTAEMQKMSRSEQQTKNIYKPENQSGDVESSFSVIFDNVIDMAKLNGLKIYSIEYSYNPPEDEIVSGAADTCDVCVLHMELISDYSALEEFLKELYKYPYLININNLELIPYPKDKKILLSDMQIKLYSYK